MPIKSVDSSVISSFTLVDTHQMSYEYGMNELLWAKLKGSEILTFPTWGHIRTLHRDPASGVTDLAAIKHTLYTTLVRIDDNLNAD